MDDSKDGYLIITDSMNKYGDRSGALGKEFGRLKTRLGYGRQHVFHSIRITMITQLIRASVPGTLIAELVGHETGLVTFDVYSQGASAGQKLAALGRLPALPSVQVAATKHGQALPDKISDGVDLNSVSNAR
ncbi:hypothetical protein [Pseudomonas sp. F3-2]|uniref:hypothetical protein n=1 Tax=Pseudomonas sp. F3-2 TaxID=3141539 RepID=UPI00315DBDDF